jgi:four helix bundle protein
MTNQPPRDLGERTFRFACAIVRFCRQLSAEPGVVRNIAWQLADAGTSVAANYEEARGSYSRREFAAKNAIVLKECREARLWLRVILAEQLAPSAEAQPLYDEANQLVGIFTTGVRRLKATLACVTIALAGTIMILGFKFSVLTLMF